MRKFLIILFFIFFIAPISVSADDYGVGDLYDEVPSDALDILEEIGIFSTDDVWSISYSSLFDEANNIVAEKALAPLKMLVLCIAVIVLSSFIVAINDDNAVLCELASLLTVCVFMIPSLIDLINSTNTVATNANIFELVLIPVYAVLQIASGNALMGGSFGTITIVFSNILISLCRDIILPLLACFVGLSISAVFSHLNIKSVCESIYKLIKWVLVFAVTIFSAIISVQSALMGATDVATTKTVKFLTGVTVPIIGSALGDGISALQNSVKLLRSGASAFGMIVIVCIFLAPVIELILWMLSCQISIMVAEIFSFKKMEEVLSVFMTVLKILLAVMIAVFTTCIVTSSVSLFGGG